MAASSSLSAISVSLSELCCALAPLWVEPFVCLELSWGGMGYRNSARWVCEAMIATLLLLLKARCALMKTSMLAMAAERGRVSRRRYQAWGFVSRIMVRREGGGSGGVEAVVSNVCTVERYMGVGDAACHLRSCRSDLNRRPRSL